MNPRCLPCSAIVLVLAAAGVASGCQANASPSPWPSPWPPLSISNETSIAITLVVNGAVVATVPPGTLEDPVTAALPQRPWTIETRSPSGRVVSTLTVGATDPITINAGRGVRVDLSCGRLDVWSGPPMLGPIFSPGASGDCE